MIFDAQRHDQFVNDGPSWTHSFNLPYGHRHVNLKSCAYDGFFLTRGPTERTCDLPPNCLEHANFAIKRWQKDEGVGAKFDLGANAGVLRMSVRFVSHEPRRQCHDTRPVPLEEQPAIVFDILPGVIVVAVLLDELTYISNSFAETSIQIDEGNTKARREERARRGLAGTSGPNESNHARYSSGSVQEREVFSRLVAWRRPIHCCYPQVHFGEVYDRAPAG